MHFVSVFMVLTNKAKDSESWYEMYIPSWDLGTKQIYFYAKFYFKPHVMEI